MCHSREGGNLPFQRGLLNGSSLFYCGGGIPLVRTSLLSTLSSGCSGAAPATPGLTPPTHTQKKTIAFRQWYNSIKNIQDGNRYLLRLVAFVFRFCEFSMRHKSKSSERFMFNAFAISISVMRRGFLEPFIALVIVDLVRLFS